MIYHHLRLAWLSIKNTPVLSGLIISAIGLGIGVCITVLTVYSLMVRNPMPEYSDRLITYKLNNQVESTDGSEPRDPFAFVSYNDANGLANSKIPGTHSIHYQTVAIYKPENKNAKPFQGELRLATHGFYSVHKVPFLFGNPWSGESEKSNPYQTVLTKDLNERLFRGENSVGKRVQIGTDYFTVAGVMDDYSPVPKYFEVDSGPFEKMEGAIVPFALTSQLELNKKNGDFRCEDTFTGDGGWQGVLSGDCYWLHHWILLDEGVATKEFESLLTNYAREQQSFGRFKGPIKTEVHTVTSWLEDRSVVNKDYEFLLGVAILFLIVCLLNCIGLLLTKFIGKAREISLRRAVGASRKMIFMQHIVEVALVGAIGGVLGLILSLFGLRSIRLLYEEYTLLTNLNIQMIVTSIVLAVLATMLSGLIPAWRSCTLPAAQYLKS